MKAVPQGVSGTVMCLWALVRREEITSEKTIFRVLFALNSPFDCFPASWQSCFPTTTVHLSPCLEKRQQKWDSTVTDDSPAIYYGLIMGPI